MIERLRIIMEKEGLSASQLADKLQIQRSGLSHILSGRNNPSLDFVIKILKAFPQYDAEWFIFGDINVNNDVYKDKQQRELTLFDEDDKKGNETIKSHPYLEEKKLRRQISSLSAPLKHENDNIAVLTTKQLDDEKKEKKLMKIIMIYDDNTFKELQQEQE